MNSMTGEQSICFEKPPYLFASASVAGKKEGEGPLGEKIDLICEDPMLGEENWEKAESMLQSSWHWKKQGRCRNRFAIFLQEIC